MRYEIRNTSNGSIHMHIINDDMQIGLCSIKDAYFTEFMLKVSSADDEQQVADFLAGNIKSLDAA